MEKEMNFCLYPKHQSTSHAEKAVNAWDGLFVVSWAQSCRGLSPILIVIVYLPASKLFTESAGSAVNLHFISFCKDVLYADKHSNFRKYGLFRYAAAA
jgi:hypothetical protein